MYQLFFYLKRIQKRHIEHGNQASSMIQRIIDYIEWYYNIFLKKLWQRHQSSKYGVTKEKRTQKIIVSLTSYPKRIGTVWLTVETLLRQNMKPDMIILWLAREQFPKGINDLPVDLIRLQNRGLTIKFCDDLRSHKKYYYALQEYPEDLVILVDDDMFYPRDLVQKLFQLHSKYPDNICCMSAQVITDFQNSCPSQWRNPMLNEKYFDSNEIQVFTGSGSIFPPKVLKEDTFNKALIKNLCPYADDLWLTYMALTNHTRMTAYHPWRAFPITIYGTAADSLYYINAADGQNDVQWKQLLDYFQYGTDWKKENEKD